MTNTIISELKQSIHDNSISYMEDYKTNEEFKVATFTEMYHKYTKQFDCPSDLKCDFYYFYSVYSQNNLLKFALKHFIKTFEAKGLTKEVIEEHFNVYHAEYIEFMGEQMEEGELTLRKAIKDYKTELFKEAIISPRKRFEATPFFVFDSENKKVVNISKKQTNLLGTNLKRVFDNTWESTGYINNYFHVGYGLIYVSFEDYTYKINYKINNKKYVKSAHTNAGCLTEIKATIDHIFKRISKKDALITATLYPILLNMDKMNVKHEIYLKSYERILVPMYVEHSKYLARLVKTADQLSTKSIADFTKQINSPDFDNRWCHEVAINEIFGIRELFNADCNPKGMELEYLTESLRISVLNNSNEVGRDLRVKLIWELLINILNADKDLENYEVYSDLIEERI